MKKDIEWLKEEVWKQDIVMDKGYIYTDDLMSIINELDELEVFSQEWIDKKYFNVDNLLDEYENDGDKSPDHTPQIKVIALQDLQNAIVPKQKEVKRTQIPEWIIEWYKGANDEFSTLEDVFDNLSHDTGYSTTGSDKLRSHIMKYGGYSKMYEALSHIYFGAYEIEEEQKYIVVLGKSIYNTTTYGQIGEVNSKKIMQSVYANEEGIIAPNQYTKSEILEVKDGEGIFKRFAVKVEELEE